MQDNEVALHDTLLLIDSWTEGEKSYISTIYLMREKQWFFFLTRNLLALQLLNRADRFKHKAKKKNYNNNNRPITVSCDLRYFNNPQQNIVYMDTYLIYIVTTLLRWLL